MTDRELCDIIERVRVECSRHTDATYSLGGIYALDTVKPLLRAALKSQAGSDPQARQEWQPIESAPKDTNVKLFYGIVNHDFVWGSGYWWQGVPGDGQGWVASVFYSRPGNMRGNFQPTHWMPLPKGPKE